MQDRFPFVVRNPGGLCTFNFIPATLRGYIFCGIIHKIILREVRIIPNFTKQAIKASFIKLLNEKPLNKISVRDIVEDCGINRNSFYYHFHDIPSLIEEIVMEEADMIIQKYPSIHSLNECVNVAFHFTLENKKAV